MITDVDQALARLGEPFELDELLWKPQATNKGKTRAVAVVYADPRAFSDRLNEVAGINHWHSKYDVQVVPFSTERGYAENRKPVAGHKLVVTCTVTIDNMGSHTDVGESETGEENAATIAFAQAFKRACVQFGLGRYLYSFPKDQWCEYDNTSKKITKPPEIPPWAHPYRKCSDCEKRIEDVKFEKDGKMQTVPRDQVLRLGQQRYQTNLCADCQKVRRGKSTEKAQATA